MTQIFVFLLVALGLIFLVGRYLLNREVVFEYQKAILYKSGRFIKILEPGTHWHFPWTSSIMLYDMRVFQMEVKNQEVLSLDGISIKVSLVFEYQVSDLYKAYCLNQKPANTVYLDLQLALRNLIGTKAIEEILSSRNELFETLKPILEKKASDVGLKITTFGIKDISFPKEVKEVFTKVVKARKEGQAALEKARNEHAALRSLANAATMIKDNPELFNLRRIQALENSKGIVSDSI